LPTPQRFRRAIAAAMPSQRTVSASPSSPTSGSDSDFEVRDDCLQVKSIAKSFAHYKVPLLVTIIGEIVFCSCMYEHALRAREEGQSMPGHVEDRLGLSDDYWTVFWTFLIARILIVVLWRASAFGGQDSRYAAFFMLFSTFQWVFYLGAYYVLQEELTGLVWNPNVMVQANDTHLALQDTAMFKCINANGTLACRNQMNAAVVCKQLFDPALCSGFTWIGANGDFQKCCVKNFYSLKRPADIVGIPPIAISMTTLSSILQWVAVLAMKWILEKNPLLSGNPGGQFVAGASVDILDAVIFANYLLHNKVLYPKYGIGQNGGAALADDSSFNLLVLTWLLAITTSTLAPAVYTFFRGADSDTPNKVRTFQGALGDLTQSMRMLRSGASHKLVDEAIKLQLEQYCQESGGHAEVHQVAVSAPEGADSDEESADIESSLNMKMQADIGMLAASSSVPESGVAKHMEGGMYQVIFDVDGRQETVDITRLKPIIKREAGPLAQGCCQGWCSGAQSAHDSFDHFAEILDSIRSLFLLELPFFLWRYHFEIDGLAIDSWNVIVMGKNVVWGLHDLLVILTCNNPSATIFGYTPLASLSAMINGSAMSSVWVGPAGFFRIAADFTAVSVKRTMETDMKNLETHKAWLLVEREKLLHAGHAVGMDSVALFDAAIARNGVNISDLQERIDMVHT